MYKATEEIYDAFLEADLHCQKDENERVSYVSAGISSKLTSFKLLFLSQDDDNDVAIRVYEFVRFDEDKKGSVLYAANKLNKELRFVKFVVDLDDNTVSLEADMPVNCEGVGKIAVEMLARIMKMADQAYSEFMKAIWST